MAPSVVVCCFSRIHSSFIRIITSHYWETPAECQYGRFDITVSLHNVLKPEMMAGFKTFPCISYAALTNCFIVVSARPTGGSWVFIWEWWSCLECSYFGFVELHQCIVTNRCCFWQISPIVRRSRWKCLLQQDRWFFHQDISDVIWKPLAYVVCLWKTQHYTAWNAHILTIRLVQRRINVITACIFFCSCPFVLARVCLKSKIFLAPLSCCIRTTSRIIQGLSFVCQSFITSLAHVP